MAINKVEYNGEVLMDLTEDTVTEETLASGVTAHNAAGESITGRMTIGVQSDWAQTDETQLDYIKNKPGDLIKIENDEEILNISSLPIGEDADGIIDTIFTHSFSPLNEGEKVQVELKLLDQEDPIVFNDIEVISDGEDGQIIIINTNQSLDEAVENGLIKNDDTLPAFFLYFSGEDTLDLISWEDYSGSSLKINKKTQTADYIKLSANALNLDTEVKKDSSNLITSGGVYKAIENIDIGKSYTAGNLIKIEKGVISSTLGDEHTSVQETQVLETNYLANGDNAMMPPFYVWQYLDNPTPFVIGDNVYLYCTDSSGIEKLVGEGVMEQNDSIDAVFGSGDQIGCKFNVSSSWSDLFGLSTGVPIINPVDSSITINGNIAQFIFLQNLNVPNMVVFGAAQDYPNIKFRVSKDVLSTVYVKLPNEALTFDDMPIGGSENLITSGGVYEAIENGKEIVYIPAELGFNESGIPTTATLVGATHADMLGYIEQGKEPKLKVFSEVIGLQSGLFSLVFHTIDDSLVFQLTMPTDPYWIINITVTQNATTLQTVQNLNNNSIVDDTVDDIDESWDDYIPTVGASKRLISTMTSKNLKPFEVVATVDFQNNTLINVEANGQSQTEADIYQLITDAYIKNYHCYISGDLSQVYYGYIGFLQLTIFSSEAAIFEQVININNKYYHMRATIIPGNVFIFTATELINEEQIFAEIQRIEEIANGKCQSFVFDTQLKLETEIENYKNNELSEGDILYNIKLEIGDIFLIKDTKVPDYWWDGSGISELETTNIDPNNYYTKTEIEDTLGRFYSDMASRINNLDKSLATVAKTGDYNDLINKPEYTIEISNNAPPTGTSNNIITFVY